MNPLAGQIGKAKSAFFTVAFFSAVLNLLALTLPLYMMLIFDKVLTSNSVPTLLLLSLVAIGGFAVGATLDAMRSLIFSVSASRLEQAISPAIFAETVNFAVFRRDPTADYLRHLTTLRNFLASSIPGSLLDSPWLFIYLAVIFVLHPYLGYIDLAGALLLVGLAILTDRLTKKASIDALTRTQRASNIADSMFRNSDVIVAMGLTANVLEKWSEESNQSRDASASAERISAIMLATFRFARLALQIVLISVAAWLVIEEELTPGGLFAVSLLSSRALAPVEQAIATWRQSRQALEAYQRLYQFLDRPALPRSGLPLPSHKGHLRFENVVYGLPQRAPILRGLNCEVKPGEVLVVMGPSASGKSTLSRLAVGLVPPSSGRVRLDGADLFNYPRASIGPHIGYLPQTIELFDGTVAENIGRMQTPEMAAVVDAAMRAGCHNMILAMPDGYATKIGDAGVQLSGGQRQRVALARAIYGTPKMVVLDEPNSNLDPDGDGALNTAIQQLKAEGAAILLVSHRARALEHADNVLVMRGGAIEMYGPKDVILERMSKGPAASQIGRDDVVTLKRAQ
jgi:PrtD family type I secretion system ABC transporter